MGEKMIKFRCKDCGGELQFDSQNRNILYCPYCRSSNIIVESDMVKIAQIGSDLIRDIMDRRRKAKEEEEKENDKDFVRAMLWIFVGIPVGICVAIIFFKVMGYVIRAL